MIRHFTDLAIFIMAAVSCGLDIDHTYTTWPHMWGWGSKYYHYWHWLTPWIAVNLVSSWSAVFHGQFQQKEINILLQKVANRAEPGSSVSKLLWSIIIQSFTEGAPFSWEGTQNTSNIGPQAKGTTPAQIAPVYTVTLGHRLESMTHSFCHC